MTINDNMRALLAAFDGEVDELVYASFRYYLGRRTIATCCFARQLASAWPYLREDTQAGIGRELMQAFHDDDRARVDGRDVLPLGHNCDRNAWELVRVAANGGE